MVVGVAAFSGSLRGSSQFRQNGVLSSRPPAGNASRWAAKNVRMIDSPLWSAEDDQEGELKEHACEDGFCIRAISGIDLMPESIIHTQDLCRSFGTIKAVDDLSMDVPAGIVFGFLGPNGAGKTTTIHLLLGILEPSQGQARVLGFDTRKQADEIRKKSGALLEFSGLYERLSAEDNLDLYGRIYRMSASERKARAKELLTHLELWDRRREKVGNWSRGMKQKIAIARALFHHPPLVFLDEPTAGLDPVAAAALHADLTSLVANEGVTVFLNTHNLAEAEKLCAQVGVIRKGKLLALGNPDELRLRESGNKVEIIGRGFDEKTLALLQARPEVQRAEIQNSRLMIDIRGKSKIGPLVTLIVQSGAEVEDISRRGESLEDLFLTLMQEEHQ
jgi:ABC-2 type transport system ATP-binding protein